MDVIIGRKDEQTTLKRVYDRSSSDFIAVYGRRRVGKTYLIRNYFKAQKCIYFEATGLKDGALHQQIKLFVDKISEVFYNGFPLQSPDSWLDVFKLLTATIEKQPAGHKVVIFLDELPWFSTQKSGFMQALDYYWNTKWSIIKNFKLVVCGSAASWMLDQLIHAKGGLHNRLTAVIPLRPFTLKETQEYLLYKGVRYNHRQVIDLYMAIGGIPHYLNDIYPGFSVAQNLNKLCFQKDGFLFDEFTTLFASLFDKYEVHNELIRLLAQSRQGLSRAEILSKTKLVSSGGTFKKRLLELEEAGFIASFTPYGFQNKETFFRVSDEYVLFYLKWIEPASKRLKMSLKNESYWESKMQSQSWKSWAGYAFEAVCLKHIEAIKKALGIQVIAAEIGSWRYVPKKSDSAVVGCQIDLLIDRADGIINLCEMKYYDGKFVVSKKIADELEQKAKVFKEQSKTNKPIHITLVAPEGAIEKSSQIISNVLTTDDLFA